MTFFFCFFTLTDFLKLDFSWDFLCFVACFGFCASAKVSLDFGDLVRSAKNLASPRLTVSPGFLDDFDVSWTESFLGSSWATFFFFFWTLIELV